MSIDPTLLQALLAMDSYNRDNGGLKLENKSIGPYSYIDSIEVGAFAATAYRLTDGSILISYRGTDNPDPGEVNDDVLTGWVAGAGWSGTTQVGQAIDFYRKIRDANPGEEIVLTGHSLGGGNAR